MRVLRDPQRKRVAPARAEKVVGGIYRATDEAELAHAWIERKYRGKNLAAWLSVEKNFAAGTVLVDDRDLQSEDLAMRRGEPLAVSGPR